MSYSFWGHSDDCAEVDGDVRDEVDTCGSGAVRWRIGDARGGCFVTASYADGDGAVWGFKVEQIDEGVPMPWNVSAVQEHEYSIRVTVECPPGTPLSCALLRNGAPDGEERVLK